MSSLTEIRGLLKKSFLLNEKEIVVYQACLEQGFLNPSEIARLTGIKRTTIYLVLEDLKSKGLLVERIKGKRKIVGAAPPETLRRLVEREQEKVTEKNIAIENIIPLLENLQKSPGENTEIEILEGTTGAITLIEKILQAKSDIHWLGSLETMLHIIDEEKFYKLMTWRRMDQSTTAYAITDRSILENKKLGERMGNFRQYRFLEKPFELPALVILYGDTVCLVRVTGKKTKIVLVRDATIYQIVRFMFDTMWQTLPEN
jgi:predicted transcriptional regulator